MLAVESMTFDKRGWKLIAGGFQMKKLTG